MKKVLILLIFSFLTCFVTFAQNSSNSTVILTAEQYNALPINVKESIEKEYEYISGDGESVASCYGGLLVIIAIACLIMFV